MNWGRAFAMLMCCENFCASLVYFYQRDVRHGFYFLFASAITFTVIV